VSPGGLRPGEHYGLDLGYAAGARQALDHLGAILRRGETVQCAATAFLEGRSGLVVATTERLLFVYRDEIPIDAPYADITRFRAKAGVLTADLEFEDSTGRAVLRQIHPRSRLVDLVGILQGRPGGTEHPADPEATPAPVPVTPARAKEEAWTPKLRSSARGSSSAAPHQPGQRGSSPRS